MRTIVAATVLLLLLLTGAWFVLGSEAPRAAGPAGAPRPPAQGVAAEAAPRGPETPAELRRALRRTSRAEREALRQRILEAMEERGRAAEPRAGAAEDAAAAEARRRKSGAAGPVEEGATPAGLVDRSGNHGYLLKVMNEDLMPLVDECYALARAGKPDLEGALVLDVEILSDEELGGVVESIEPGRANALTDPTLDECVRESLLSVTLPRPPTGGRDAISLDLRLEPEEPERGGS